MNKVCLIGRITKDPELKYTQSNVAVVSFTIAVDRSFKDAQGNKVTDFINCVAWRSSAEFIGQWIKKGNLIAVLGQIQTRSYSVSQTESRQVTEVIVESVENLTPKEIEKEETKDDAPFTYNDAINDLPF